MKSENVHDLFFKQTFSNKGIARALLEQFLPKNIVEQLDFSSFELSKDSFISKKLKEHFADLVYECCLNNGQKVSISLLLEHKSYVTKYPHFQLLQYMLGSWEQSQKNKERPKLVIPIIKVV